jgi:hypothetical protein
MPRVGFELTIPAFKRAKTVHALDRAATVSGNHVLSDNKNPTCDIIINLPDNNPIYVNPFSNSESKHKQNTVL